MEREDVTRLVSRLRSGDRTAFDALLGLTYRELRQLARSHLRHERSDHTLNPTGLVHEVWMRLSQQRDHSFDNRAHFFGAVSHAMRRVLVDHARGRAARKRRGERVSLDRPGRGHRCDAISGGRHRGRRRAREAVDAQRTIAAGRRVPRLRWLHHLRDRSSPGRVAYDGVGGLALRPGVAAPHPLGRVRGSRSVRFHLAHLICTAAGSSFCWDAGVSTAC